MTDAPMTPVEELDLARARVLYGLKTGLNSEDIERFWSKSLPVIHERYLEEARAIRLGDEARGLRVVPVEATIDMIVAGTEAWLVIAAMEDRAEAIWATMLAASPFAPKDGV